jgi:hypothetical protein
LLIDYLFADSLQTIESSGGAVEVDRDVVDTLLLDDAVLRDRAIDAIDLLFARDEQATDRQMSVLDKLFLLTVQETYRTRDRTIVDLLFTDETQAALTERIQSALDNLLIRDDAFRDRQLSLIDRFVIASLVSASSQGINLRDITDRLFLLENPITRETESTWTNALFSRSVDDRLSERNRADLDYLFTDTVLAQLKETVRSATDSMYTDSLAAREREHTAGTDKLFIYSGTGRREAVLGFVEYVLSLEQQSFDNARQLTDKLFVLSVQDVLSAGIFLRDITDELFLRSTDERSIALEQINKALLLTTQTVEYVAQVIDADDLFVDDARKFVLERALLDSMLLTSQLLGRTTELLQKFDLLLRDERTTEQERAFFETVLLNSIADTLLETAAQVRTVTDYLLVLSAEARASDKQITSNLLLDSLSTALREVIVLREIVDRLLTFDDLQEQRELIADADNLFTSDTVDRVIQRFGNVVDAVDSLLMRDARTSDRSFVADFDSLFVNALRSSSVAHSFVNLLLVRDAADAFTGIERLVVDNVLFADSVLRGFEKLNLDGLNVTSISEVVKTGVVFRQALDAILLLDTASTQLPLIQSTDTLLLRDARLTELARLARSTLLTQSQRTSALEASQRDNVFVDQATADRIRTALAGTVDNVLLDETLTKLLDSSQVDHLFLEQTAAVAGKEIARELAEAVFLLDSRAQSGRDIYVADTVLLKAIATRIKELLYANNLFLDETSAAQWYPVVVEFITYARLGTSVVLGLVTDNEELIAGQRLSWQDLLGRVTGVGRWREQPTPLIFSAGGFASGFDSGFNV